MFRFHDVPKSSPGSAGIHAGSEASAAHEISVAWEPYGALFPDIAALPAKCLAGGTTRLARALFIDAKCQMPLVSCKAILDVYMSMEHGFLHSRPMVGLLPGHHKRMAAEFFSNAASISAAQRAGYQFFGNRTVIRALFPTKWLKGVKWDNWDNWKGKGPDFLMSGPKGCAFLEVKGSTGAAALSFNQFCLDKAQSVNADLRPFGGRVRTRHVLSRVFSPPGEMLSVHWFNQDERDMSNVQPYFESVVLIAVGLAQFITQISNAGYDASALLEGRFKVPNEARSGHGYVMEPNSGSEFTIGISYAALRVFAEISNFLARLRVEKPSTFENNEKRTVTRLANRLLGLRSYFGGRRAAWRNLDRKPIYTYSTGIFVIGPRDHEFAVNAFEVGREG
jgi:hypothetical protein